MEQSKGRDLADGSPEIVREASPLTSCFWCERFHPGEHRLSVCPACTSRYSPMRSLEMNRPYSGRSGAGSRRTLPRQQLHT